MTTKQSQPKNSVHGVRAQIDSWHTDQGLDYIRDNPNRAPSSKDK